jgi:hypothetical protein
MMAKRVCLTDGCPTLTDTTRCADHTRERDRARGSASARGYDGQYREQLKSPAYRTATHCAECGQVFTVDNPKTGGHSVALRNGGKGSKILPHCRRCNYGWERTGL